MFYHALANNFCIKQLINYLFSEPKTFRPPMSTNFNFGKKTQKKFFQGKRIGNLKGV
jgi:hypothetical protein